MRFPERLIGYGVELLRLTEADLELVRYWRNHPSITRYMEYREHITQQMQQNWFIRINNDRNFYATVEWCGQKVGLANLRDIDYQAHCAESGIFFWDEQCLNSLIPFRAHFALHDWGFDNLRLEYAKAHILRDNLRAIRFNRMLGHVLQPGQESVQNQLYLQTRAAYFLSRDRYAHLLE